jgi:hypothetical protein
MPSATHKPSTALPKRELAALIHEARAFDVRLVTSALVYFNEWNVVRDSPEVPVPGIVELAYAWLPLVLRERAKLADVPVSNVCWKPGTYQELGDAYVAASFLLRPSRVDRGRNPEAKIGFNGRLLTAAEWFTRCLAPLRIYSRFVFDGSTLRKTEVPLINNVMSAVAYAIAVVLDNRWQVRDRIRRCPYDRRGEHFFLDYRTDDKGRFLAGEQMKYCCPAHANAHRQLMYRSKPK